ncbi:MAG: T9SS type A sorting domain-containing protein [Bacteroidota bacterium]
MGHRKVPHVYTDDETTIVIAIFFMKEYSMHTQLLITIMLCCYITPLFAFLATPITILQTQNNELCMVLNTEHHLRLGAAYPMTYHIAIPAGSQNLKAFKKHNVQDGWYEINQKTSSDFFNGIETARFDYDSNRAFISVAFASGSDSLWLKIGDQSGNDIIPQYIGITQYYDNRRAVVTVTADDWADWSDSMFPELMYLFRSRKLYVTGGVISRFDWTSPATWNHLQKQLDSGYFEVVSHSQTHPHIPYTAAASEVAGSYQDIVKNLTLPQQFRNGSKEYVYVWIAPYGEYDNTVDSLVSTAGYLVSRLYVVGDADISQWNLTKNMFEPSGLTLEIGAPSWGGGTIDTTFMKNTFNSIVAAGGVYHLMWHPQVIYPDRNKKYLHQHLDYISNRNDIWYVNYGHLYLYRSLQQEYEPVISDVRNVHALAQDFMLEQNFPNPFNPQTTIRYSLRTPVNVRLVVSDALGREIATVVDGFQHSGTYEASFNGTELSSGIYMYRLTANGMTISRKMALIK